MPTARRAPNCHASSELTSPASPTYQMATWSRPRATAAATTVRTHSFHSCTARAFPYPAPGGLGPPASRCAACPSSHLIV